MAEQRIMTIHLRKAMERVPPYKRSGSAAKFVRTFVLKHMKAKGVSIDNEVNDEIFKKGGKNPPVRIRVMCSKNDEGKVSVKLIAASTGEKQ